MSAAAFERLLYTDCRAGQGRGGGAGFQIQAQSSGVTAGMARLAVNTLLYTAPTEWLNTKAVEDFPLGLAHTSGEGWGTAQSRYLGREVTGSRSGNHLADCLLTTDLAPYGAIRPAQLFESSVWRDAPFDAIECAPYDDFLEPGPLTNDEIQEWLRDDESRAEALRRLVTVLENPKSPQVVIVALTTEEAVRWIAAATVLLPIRAALNVTFKVFVTDLNRSPQRIIGISRELNPSVTPESLSGKFVIDAATGRSSGGAVSERANYWVKRLIASDDPYDVVEAVDFAQLLTVGDELDTAEARVTAWSITAESEPLTDAEPIIKWLRERKDPDLELGEHESAAAHRIISSGLADSSSLSWMEGQADQDQLYVDRAELRQALLKAEVAEAETAFAVRSEELTHVNVGDGPRRDAESAISEALLLAKDADVVDRLLQIARRHQLALAVPPLRDRLSSFIAEWIADPSRTYDPGKWALSDHLVQELADQLRDGGADLAQVKPLLAQTWIYLLHQINDPLQPLTWELCAAGIFTAADGAPKEREIQRIIGTLKKSDRPDDALAGLQNALVRWRAISGRETLVFVDALGRGIPLNPKIADEAIYQVRKGAKRPDKLILDAIGLLEDRRILPFHPDTDNLSKSDRHVDTFIEAARALRSLRNGGQLPDLTRVSPHVLRLRSPDLVAVSLEDAALPLLGAIIIDSLPLGGKADFLDAWGSALASERGPLATARGYLWSESPQSRLPNANREVIADSVARYASTLTESERAGWIRTVESLLNPVDADGFKRFLGGIKRHVHLPGRGRKSGWDEAGEDEVDVEASAPAGSVEWPYVSEGPVRPVADAPTEQEDVKRSSWRGRLKRD